MSDNCPNCGYEPEKPTNVITVRLPRSVYESLKQQAKAQKKSLNQFCVDRLRVPLRDLLGVDQEKPS